MSLQQSSGGLLINWVTIFNEQCFTCVDVDLESACTAILKKCISVHKMMCMNGSHPYIIIINGPSGPNLLPMLSEPFSKIVYLQ